MLRYSVIVGYMTYILGEIIVLEFSHRSSASKLFELALYNYINTG